jgi:hypothetical protein
MEQLIRFGIQSNMLVDVAIDGGKNPDIYLRSDVKGILLRYEKNIVIHAVGEAYESTGLAWATRVKGVIGRLRAAGCKAPLYVLTIDGGRSLPVILNYGAEILASDPLKNAVFGWQAYWGSSNYYQNRYGMTLAQAMARVRDAAFPIQVGLLRTTDPGETMNYSAVMADAQAYGIGWLWWDWRWSTDDLTTNGTYWLLDARGPGRCAGQPERDRQHVDAHVLPAQQRLPGAVTTEIMSLVPSIDQVSRPTLEREQRARSGRTDSGAGHGSYTTSTDSTSASLQPSRTS